MVPVEVLFVSPSMAGGGAEQVLLTLLRHLDRSRFRPTLAVADRSGPLLASLPEDVAVFECGGGRVRAAWRPLVTLVRRRRPAVVCSFQGHMNLVTRLARPFFPRATRVLAREANIPSRKIASGADPRWFAPLYRRLYPGFDAVICQSEEMYEDMVEVFGLPASKAVRIPNPVDVELLQREAAAGESVLPASGRPQLVAMGRLAPQKGFDVLLRALALLQPPRPSLTIMGTGPLEAELRGLARELGVDGDVHFAGYVANPCPSLAAADLFVLSSRYEGFPNALVEALALGTPAVACACPGGVREIMADGTGGWLAPPEDPPALAALLQAHQHPGLDRQALAADIAARFGAAAVTARYEALLAGAMPQKPR